MYSSKLQLNEIKELFEQGHRTKSFYMKRYNVSERTVRRAFSKLGLKCESEYEELCRINLQDAIRDYVNGDSISIVSKKYGFNIKSMRKLLKEAGVYRNEQPRYEADFDFFRTIDTEEKAYWLGFIYADGCLKGKHTLSIAVNKKDRDMLEKFLASMKATYPIATEKADQVRVTMTNPRLYNHLVNKGVTPRKTLTLLFPTEDIVPSHLIHHFVRGYFDGDGCITYSGKKENRQRQISFVGTEAFLTELKELLSKEVGLSDVKLFPRRQSNRFTKQLFYGGNGNAKKIFEWMYKDATIYMERKYNRFIT